jgi:hypothetical protein
MGIVELKEVAGYMYVNAEHSIVARFGYCPKADAHLWKLTTEAEALAIEAKWRAERGEQQEESN